MTRAIFGSIALNDKWFFSRNAALSATDSRLDQKPEIGKNLQKLIHRFVAMLEIGELQKFAIFSPGVAVIFI